MHCVATGDVYVGCFEHDLPHGRGIYVKTCGDFKCGTFEAGKLHEGFGRSR